MRKKKVIKRHPVSPDKKFASVIVGQLVNKIMKGGEKRKAVKIVYQAAQIIETDTSLPFLTILEGALENVKPSLETKSRKRGGSNQRVPIKVDERRALTLALR
jgi:small subunit ribosomal protein S7